ncbi:MAG: aspartyl/asparaginyl beta-hydroxylase domain-containing protein [Flavobacteriales bacterium]|nr:aspartyl/asparaginyl beta-hydroxylase domain-containing protein [Flavobacteriales bacterium]
MKIHKEIWYNYWMPPYQSEEPNFYDPNDFKWAEEIKALTAEVKIEILKILNDRGGDLIPYYSEAVSTDKNKWVTLAFKTWGIDVKENLLKAPTISQFLQRHPYIVSASMNLLKPHSTLNRHQGDTNAIFRCHLGISVEASLPELGFEVEGEKRSWQEGDLLIFIDAKEHAAWNNSNSNRLIFLFDVIREEFLPDQKKICINVRAFLLLQWIGGKFKYFLKLPKWLHRIVHWKIKVLLYIIHPYQKKKGVIIKHT